MMAISVNAVPTPRLGILLQHAVNVGVSTESVCNKLLRFLLVVAAAFLAARAEAETFFVDGAVTGADCAAVYTASICSKRSWFP